MENKKIVIVTGLSGSGKTTALNLLEDLGYYTIDNLPCEVGQTFVNSSIPKIALGIDIRSFKVIDEFIEFIKTLKDNPQIELSIIFLEATTEVILNRYNLTRRRHPLEENTLLESITKEGDIMGEIKEYATGVIDTTSTSSKELIEKIKVLLDLKNEGKEINIHIQSFGFKYGIPIDVDLVFDVRFLPNPYYIANLKPKSGLDIEVQKYVLEFEVTKEFYNKLISMLEFLVPLYIKEGKKHLTIGIGCSGGKHRSVTIAQKLYQDLKTNKKFNMYISHREKESGKW